MNWEIITYIQVLKLWIRYPDHDFPTSKAKSLGFLGRLWARRDSNFMATCSNLMSYRLYPVFIGSIFGSTLKEKATFSFNYSFFDWMRRNEEYYVILCQMWSFDSLYISKHSYDHISYKKSSFHHFFFFVTDPILININMFIHS